MGGLTEPFPGRIPSLSLLQDSNGVERDGGGDSQSGVEIKALLSRTERGSGWHPQRKCGVGALCAV